MWCNRSTCNYYSLDWCSVADLWVSSPWYFLLLVNNHVYPKRRNVKEVVCCAVECNCNAQGSLDNFCDLISGDCLCRSNINSRTCDRCHSGMYQFPRCVSCRCNAHAAECEDATGVCIDCKDNTRGDNCDSCVDGKLAVCSCLYLW